jgi:hypothetical protein
MPLSRARPVNFTPAGITDAFDATRAFPGACRLLKNLVFDQGNPELVQCRPAAVSLTTFGGFTTPTFVTCYVVIGNICYGMVSTAANPGFDQPFAYDIVGNSFYTVTGFNGTNTPASPPTTGPWTPPSMTVVGKKIIIAHAGFSGTGSNFFGVIDITNPTAPTWTSTNTATTPLPGVPTVVANLNNRCWFFVSNVGWFSDPLNPTTITSSSQSVTFGDPTPVTAANGLPVQTTSAGVVQALLVFKAFSVWQITGDPVTQNLANNFLSLNVGTSAPRSVVQTPYGTNFMAIDGPYIVDMLGAVKPLTKTTIETVQDIQIPFIFATQPSRVSAGYSGGIYRICVDTTIDGSPQTNEYWFDIERRRWNGPHSFPQDNAAQFGNFFIISHVSKGAALFKSELISSPTSTYVEDGQPMSFQLLSSTFPKDGSMNEKQVTESTIEFSTSGPSVSYSITAFDARQKTLDATTVVIPAGGAVWGGFLWGGALWSSATNVPDVYTVPWHVPLVFQKMALQVTGSSSSNISIGAFFARYQDLGYMNQQQVAP